MKDFHQSEIETCVEEGAAGKPRQDKRFLFPGFGDSLLYCVERILLTDIVEYLANRKCTLSMFTGNL
jgi:hypothetical protein